MPTVTVETRTGAVDFHYCISTGEDTFAESVNPDLPTLLFIHASYVDSVCFHAQFKDPQLRGFNLVAPDLRAYGLTTGASVRHPYSAAEAAEDIARFMDAAKLPPSHLIGLSSGTMIVFELAITFPERVLSIFQMSPLGLPEPESVDAFLQINDLWKEGMLQGDESMLHDAMSGVKQFGITETSSHRGLSLTESIFSVAFNRGRTKWGPSLENVDQLNKATIQFFINSKLPTVTEFAKIRAPVHLVHGGEDLVHKIEYTQDFGRILDEAEVPWELSVIPRAPHLISCECGKEVNPILHDFVMRSLRQPVQLSLPPKCVSSPWDEVLREVGYGDSEDEEFIYHHGERCR